MVSSPAAGPRSPATIPMRLRSAPASCSRSPASASPRSACGCASSTSDAQAGRPQRNADRPQLGTEGGRAARPQPVRTAGRSDRAARHQRPHHLRQRRLLRTCADRRASALVGSRFDFRRAGAGRQRPRSNGTRIHDQKIATPLGARWIAWREGYVRLDAGQPAEMQSVGRDVTDRTETERALSDARDQADAANRAKSRFLAMARTRSARRSTASSAWAGCCSTPR